jgi:hypothetical protein
MTGWTFLTNHAHVFLCLAKDPGIRLRDVADKVGITERAAQRILADLEADGYVISERVGRRNQYLVNRTAPLRHPLEDQHSVAKLLRLIEPPQLEERPVRRSESNAAAGSDVRVGN